MYKFIGNWAGRDRAALERGHRRLRARDAGAQRAGPRGKKPLLPLPSITC